MPKPLLDIDAQLASMEADERTGAVDLPRVTSQQRVYAAARIAGLSLTAAAKEAGCAPATARKWEADPDFQAYLQHYQDEFQREVLPRVSFGIEDAHAMYMRAYHLAGTAGEMVKATDSLVKLHRLNETPKTDLPKVANPRQLADLPLAELMRLAGLQLESLTPALDGEYQEVPPG